MATVFTAAAAGCPILVLHDKNHPQMVFCGQLDKLSVDIWQKDEFSWLFSTFRSRPSKIEQEK